jgi:hypothetical protein
MFNSIFQVVNEILIIKKIDNKNNTAKVERNSTLYDVERFWLPVKAIQRLIPWPPVGAVVQVIDQSLSSGIDMEQDVVRDTFLISIQFNLIVLILKKLIDGGRFWTR